MSEGGAGPEFENFSMPGSAETESGPETPGAEDKWLNESVKETGRLRRLFRREAKRQEADLDQAEAPEPQTLRGKLKARHAEKKAEKVEKVERVEKAERPEKVERVEKVERPEKVERVEKVERPEKVK